jgi:FKBP-type peptidyl-prolyl cis-trans isomerase 2
MIKKGDKIKVEYEGKLEDGTVFDSSEKTGKPLEFEVGSGTIIPGFDNAVVGMKKGEEKEVKIEAKDAYGEPNPQMIKKIPKDQLPEDKEIKPGMVLAVSMPNGAQMPVKVKEVSDNDVTLDLNHPLAGKNLDFKIKIVDIS